MRIEAKIISSRTLAGKEFSQWKTVTLPEGAGVSELLPILEGLYPGEHGQPGNGESDPVTVFVNGRSADFHTALREGDRVNVLRITLIGG